ncbi:MAG: hypothetical protein ACRCYM_06025, partial [Cetobacterium sp.]
MKRNTRSNAALARRKLNLDVIDVDNLVAVVDALLDKPSLEEQVHAMAPSTSTQHSKDDDSDSASSASGSLSSHGINKTTPKNRRAPSHIVTTDKKTGVRSPDKKKPPKNDQRRRKNGHGKSRGNKHRQDAVTITSDMSQTSSTESENSVAATRNIGDTRNTTRESRRLEDSDRTRKSMHRYSQQVDDLRNAVEERDMDVSDLSSENVALKNQMKLALQENTQLRASLHQITLDPD